MVIVQRIFYFIIIPAAVMYLFEAITHNPFVRMNIPIQLLNIILFLILTGMLFFAFGSLRLALMVLTVLFLILSYAEYYLIDFRGVPFLPWDLGSLGTAAEVAGGYDYMPSARALICTLGFIVIFVISCFADLRVSDISDSIVFRIGGTLLFAVLIFLYTLFIRTETAARTFGLYTKLFTPTAMSERDGTLTAFLWELQYVNVKKPAGYDREEVKELLAGYEGKSAGEDRPNIIVIMNEAFSDLGVLGDFETNTDYMPFVHSLETTEGDHETGILNVSIVGGNTPNTEFEFLTGNSLAFLPEGSIPYQQYVDEGIEALPGYLSSIGYKTVGVHPYYAKGWDRKRVYEDMGFEKSLFLDDLDKEYDMLRGYVSDKGDFDILIEEYEKNKNTGRPLFIFNVTMQNHSPYDKAHPDLTEDVLLKGDVKDKKTDSTQRYLTLIKRSDEAFKALTEYFAKQDDKTIIVMFGDHQPSDSVVRPVWKLAGKDPGNLDDEDFDKRYMVPYVIWANYDPGFEGGRDMSANYLGNRILELAGLGMSPYREFLDDMQERYPVFSAVRIQDGEGNVISDKEAAEDSLTKEYKKLQYYELFDK